MKKNVFIVILVSVWIILAVVFGFFDLNISKQVVNQNFVWAIFLENYGMIPGMFVILSGIYIYCSFIKLKSDAWSYIQRVVLFLVSSGLIIYLLEILLDRLVSENFITSLIIAFAVNLIIFIVLQIRKQVESISAIQYAKIVIGISFFGYVICVQAIKYVWGRVRFRELDAAFSQFTPWYMPQGITGFDSFPSGHAAMGFMLLSILILLVNAKRWLKNSVVAIIFLYGMVLAMSRVVIGAHYASDVMFGSFFIIVSFLVFSKSKL
jgi:membrane-associated phospholipid phosphatase